MADRSAMGASPHTPGIFDAQRRPLRLTGEWMDMLAMMQPRAGDGALARRKDQTVPRQVAALFAGRPDRSQPQ
jgi:hypothetical protein